jgi:apolipoprotein N-acyltransferase
MQSAIFLSILSALLLVVSFPRFSWGYLAWIALIPLFWAMDHCKNLKEILICTGIAGWVFFGFSMFWLNHVALAGW